MSGWLPGFLLALIPLLVLVGLLVGGRYPGEAVLDEFRRVITRAFATRRAGPRLWSPSPPTPGRIRGGRLIGSSLASRGPPLHIPAPQIHPM